jgi:heme-binding protein
VFVGIQFIPTNRNQSDEILETDFAKTFNVPSDIQNLFEKSCYDCHSNNTNYPWYNKIQPASWFLEKHVKEGKKELNFSEFGANSKRKQRSKLKSIISQIRDDEMPMLSYTLIHRGTKLSNSEKELIINWVTKLRDSL